MKHYASILKQSNYILESKGMFLGSFFQDIIISILNVNAQGGALLLILFRILQFSWF